MFSLSMADHYTTLPPSRTRRGRREQQARRFQSVDSTSDPQLPAAMANTRRELLDLVASTVIEEEKKMEDLMATFDPSDSQATARSSSPISSAFGGSRDLRERFCDSPDQVYAGDADNFVAKHDLLLTPHRQRYFPRASPSVLRYLLSSPSVRIFTPEHSLTSANLADTPESQNMLLETSFLADLRALRDGCSSPRLGHSLLNHTTLHSLPPSPPPSTELPSLESFPLPISDPSPYTQQSSPRPTRPMPFLDSRRSSHGCPHLGLFPEAISPTLRAAPCSPLVTRTVVDGGPPSPSPAYLLPYRASDPRHLMHNHLAFGVVRDFQRVLDELQGLGPDSPHSHPGSEFEVEQPLSLSQAQAQAGKPDRDPDPDRVPKQNQQRECGGSMSFSQHRLSHSAAAEILLAELGEEDENEDENANENENENENATTTTAPAPLLPSPSLGSPDRPTSDEGGAASAHTNAKQRAHAHDGFSVWERRLSTSSGLVNSRPAPPSAGRSAGSADGSRSRASSPPLRSTSLDSDGLQEEFIALLSDQASEEEAHAHQLREIADRLERMARCRRHLAEATARKRL